MFSVLKKSWPLIKGAGDNWILAINDHTPYFHDHITYGRLDQTISLSKNLVDAFFQKQKIHLSFQRKGEKLWVRKVAYSFRFGSFCWLALLIGFSFVKSEGSMLGGGISENDNNFFLIKEKKSSKKLNGKGSELGIDSGTEGQYMCCIQCTSWSFKRPGEQACILPHPCPPLLNRQILYGEWGERGREGRGCKYKSHRMRKSEWDGRCISADPQWRSLVSIWALFFTPSKSLQRQAQLLDPLMGQASPDTTPVVSI